MLDISSSTCFCSKKEVMSRLHFSPVPVFMLGNWIPSVLYYWGGASRYAQAVFTSEGKTAVSSWA